MQCTIKACGYEETIKAMASPMFLEQAHCQGQCTPYYYNDTTPGKLHFQNCTTQCALTYDSPAGDKLMGCAMAHNCVTFAPIPGNCPKPVPGAKTNLKSLEGEWWQQYGKNALWDCYPCQHIHEMKMVDDAKWCAQTDGPEGPVKAPCWSYTYSYDLYLKGGKTKYF